MRAARSCLPRRTRCRRRHQAAARGQDPPLRRLLEAGRIPLRPGVARLIAEARAAGLRLAIATTTTPENVTALLRAEPRSRRRRLVRGDRRRRRRAQQEAGAGHLPLGAGTPRLPAADCLAIEDSAIGLRAALAAGLPTRGEHQIYTVARISPVRWPSCRTSVRSIFPPYDLYIRSINLNVLYDLGTKIAPLTSPDTRHLNQGADHGPVSPLRRPQPQRSRPDRGRQAHPVRLQDEAQGRAPATSRPPRTSPPSRRPAPTSKSRPPTTSPRASMRWSTTSTRRPKTCGSPTRSTCSTATSPTAA